MGWTGDNELWVSTRGGDVLVSPTPGVSETFDNVKVPSRGFGILDVGYVSSRTVYPIVELDFTHLIATYCAAQHPDTF